MYVHVFSGCCCGCCTWSRWGSGKGSLLRDLGLARYLDCVKSRTNFDVSVYKQNIKSVLGGNSDYVHFNRVITTRHRVRTTCGHVLARSDSGIKLNNRLIRVFFVHMCFFLSCSLLQCETENKTKNKNKYDENNGRSRRRNAATITLCWWCIVTESNRMVSTITIYTSSTAA